MSDYERLRQGYIDQMGDDDGWGDDVFRDALAMERDMQAHGLDPDDANDDDWETAYAALAGSDEGGMGAGLGPCEALDEGPIDMGDESSSAEYDEDFDEDGFNDEVPF